MNAYSEVNVDSNSSVQQNWMLEQLFADAQKYKKEFEALLAKMFQIVKEITKLLQELLALVGSNIPPTPEQLAQIMGQMDRALEQAAKLREECGSLASSGSEIFGAKPGDFRPSQLLFKQLLQKADATEQLAKKLIDAVAKMLSKHGSPQVSELQQMIQQIDQLEKKLALENQKSPSN